jgi:hypothetical protein
VSDTCLACIGSFASSRDSASPSVINARAVARIDALLHELKRLTCGTGYRCTGHGRPNIGPFPCGGVVTIDSQSRNITRSGQYWAFAHYSRTIRRGAQRFQSQTTAADIKHVAVENPDGQKVLIVTNPGPSRALELRVANVAASVALKTDSVTTVAWR